MLLFWLSLAIAVAVTVGSAVYATSKGLEAFRALRHLGSSVGEGLERIGQSSAGIERHLSLAAQSGERLEASLERLRSSRARLNVLSAAVEDVRDAVGRVTGVVPRK